MKSITQIYLTMSISIKYVVTHVVMFFYIYILSFKFIPIGTRAIFGLLGFVWFVAYIYKKNFYIKINSYFLNFLILSLSIGLIAAISNSYSGTMDIEFIRYVASITLVIFSSYFVISVLKAFDYELSFKSISRLIINVVFIQSALALLMFTLPELQDFLINIQRFSDLTEQQVNVYKAYRVIGFGTMFFDAGIINGYALILIGIKIRLYKYTLTQLLLISFKFVLITIVGMAMSRTTLVGVLISLIIILIPRNLKPTISLLRNSYFLLMCIIFIPIFLIITLLLVYPESAQTFEAVLSFAFEMFINYSDNGSLATDSSDVLKTLFIWPTDIKTYLIGDGYFSDPHGNGYYMHTDVGYLRLIYYFGFGGLLIFFTMQYYAITKVFNKIGVNYIFSLFIFIYLLLLNVKGFADILSFTLLYWVYLLTAMKTKNCMYPSIPGINSNSSF